MKKILLITLILYSISLLMSCATPKQYSVSEDFPPTGRITSVKLHDSTLIEFDKDDGVFLQRNWIGKQKNLTKMDTLGILELIEYWEQYNEYLLKNYDLKNYPKDSFIIAGLCRKEGLILIDIVNIASMKIK